jgi:hypothetical protein
LAAPVRQLSDDALDECLRRCRPVEDGLDPATSRRIFEQSLSRSGVLRRSRARFAWAGTAAMAVLVGGYAVSRAYAPARTEQPTVPVLAAAPAAVPAVELEVRVRKHPKVREKRRTRRTYARHRPERSRRLARHVPAPVLPTREQAAPPAVVEQPRRELLVVVARAEPELDLSVRSAPEETPGCATVEALQQSATGEMFRVQYTVSTEREGSDTIITPVGQLSVNADPSGKAEGEWGKLSH